MTTVASTAARPREGVPAWRRLLSLHGWTIAIWLILFAMVPYWRSLSQQSFGFDIQSLGQEALPLCFAAMAQAVVVISGGIDLSVGSLMGLISVLSAKHMVGMTYREAIVFGLFCLVVAALAGGFTGFLIVTSGIPDIVVTLGMLFVWLGIGRWILSEPGGGAPQEFYDLVIGTLRSTSIPNALLVLLGAFVILWLPIRWARPGLSLYAVGSDRNAAYLSGINVSRTRIFAYMLGGVFAGLGGLALTASSGIGDPNSGSIYTLNSVAATVLGGVSLLGGIGGLIGPIAAAFVLTLAKSLLLIRGTDPNYASVYQGLLMIAVVAIGGLLARRRGP